MEKRSKTQANKSLTHVKKVQDYGPRFNKNGQRNEHRREANPCKATGTVPKTKTVQYSRQRNVVQRKLVEYDDAQEIEDRELYSVYEQGSKKQNLNHLLNFHYSPRAAPTTSWSYDKHNKLPSSYPKYDKNQFLKANCQFVVKSHEDYMSFLDGADILPQWHYIEQINIMQYESPQCPICLYPPTACRITKCGHYFCYPCLLHYLALSDKSWRKCPICNDAVTIEDLKSVLIKPVKYYNISDKIHFNLVKKESGSSFVINSESSTTDRCFPTLSDDDVIYSKAVIASVSDILQIIEREKNELSSELQYAQEELVFIEQAIEILNEREQKILEFSQNKTVSKSTKEPDRPTSDIQFKYFYQLPDGQNLFLHPINCKMLETLFGSIKDCPTSVTGYVLQKEHKTVDEALWKRYKYLQHLPLSSNIEICEIQFSEPVVPDEILEIFRDDIKIREVRRKKKEYQENVRFRKINELNEKLMGFKLEERETNINIESFEQFPDAIVGGTDLQNNCSASASFAKVLSAKSQKLWPGVSKSNEALTTVSTASNAEGDSVPTTNDTDFGNAIFEAIERGGIVSNNSQTKKKKSKKGTVLFATGLTFGK